MRWLLLTVIMLAGAIAPAAAQNDVAPALSFSVPKGAQVISEFSITREQLDSQADMLVMMFLMDDGGKSGVDANSIRSALGSLEKVEYSSLEISGAYSAPDIIATYEKELGGRRIAFDQSKNGAGFMVLTFPENPGYFVVNVSPRIEKEKVIGAKLALFRLHGMPDIAKIASLAADFGIMKIFNK